MAPRNKSKSTTAPGQRTNQPTSPAARPKYQQSPREVRRRVFPSDIDPSPSCPTPSMPSNRPQPAAGHVTPWTSCYAPPPPTRVIVPASAEHQAAHNATRSRDPRATIGHNKNARRGGSGAALPRVAENVPLARVADMTAHQLPTNNKYNNKPEIQQQTSHPTTMSKDSSPADCLPSTAHPHPPESPCRPRAEPTPRTEEGGEL